MFDASWYYKGDDNMTIWYSFDDDSDPEIAEIVSKIYAFTGIDYDPTDVILVTDGLCGSTCSCFAKHLLQLQNIRAVYIGGSNSSRDVFDVASFAGGTVMDSMAFEDSVTRLDTAYLSETEL